MCEVGAIDNGALGINVERGTIEYAGTLDGLDQSEVAPSCQKIDAQGFVVMPGFIDSHTHVVFAGSRADEFYRRSCGESYQEIARAGGGIQRTMSATRSASADELYSLARKRALSMYANGTTTLESKSGYGLSLDAELTSLEVLTKLKQSLPGIFQRTYMGAHLVPPEYKDNRAGWVDAVIAQLKQVAADGLADYYDIFVDPLAFTQEEAQRIVDAGKETALGLRLHADEFGDDGTAAWGASMGALSCDHLGGIGEEGISALAGSDTIATLLPATMFFSGHGQYAPARRMIEAGCAVALATDLNPGSSLVYSMPLAMTLAVLNMQLSAEECITASTINAAHALGMACSVGSLEQGKRADVIVLDVPHYEEIPYHVGRDIVRDVLISGQPVKRDGAMLLR
jgi:imidazolonepropionase